MIELRGLSKLQGNEVVLDRVTLTVAQGEIYGLLGPLGSGRGALLKILATLVRSSGGEAFIEGHSLASQPHEVRRRVGYQPSFFGLYDDMRVWEYLEFFALAYAVDLTRRHAYLSELLELAGLGGREGDFIDTLSLEERRRLGVIKTVIHDPPVLLLDDPAAGLEPVARRRMSRLIAELHRRGKTILLSTNLIVDLVELSPRVGLLRAGRLLREGTLAELAGTLAEERLFEVETRGDAARARDLLRHQPRVRQVDSQGEFLVFSLDDATLDPDGILNELDRQGVQVAAYREHEVDLAGLDTRPAPPHHAVKGE